MRLGHFLDVAFAILVQEYQRWDMNLFDAMEQLAEFASGYKPALADLPFAEAVRSDTEARSNKEAMDQLRTLMAGVG